MDRGCDDVGVGGVAAGPAARADPPVAAHRPSGVLDQIGALIDGLPDPLDLGPDQVVGSMTATARLRNRLDAYLVALAGTADAAHLARSLRAGSTGMLVATATGTNPAAGSGIVGTARALRHLPGVAEAFRDGRLNSRMCRRCATPPPGSPGSTRSKKPWWTWPAGWNRASCAGS